MERENNLKLPYNLGERDIIPVELLSISSEALMSNLTKSQEDFILLRENE